MLGRSRWPPRDFSHGSLDRGLEPALTARRSAATRLLIANHVSWLDILILGGSDRLRVRRQGQLGSRRSSNGSPTRTRPSTSSATNRKAPRTRSKAIAEALEARQPLTSVPRRHDRRPGTHCCRSARPCSKLRIAAAKDVVIRPVALDYGAAAAEIGWWHGDSGKDNVLRVLGRAGHMPVTIHLLPRSTDPATARRWRTHAREAIARCPRFKSGGRLAYRPRAMTDSPRLSRSKASAAR